MPDKDAVGLHSACMDDGRRTMAMNYDRWKDRARAGRETARTALEPLSNSAREAAQGASERIGDAYAHARGRAAGLISEGRDRADDWAEMGASQAGALAVAGRDLGEEALRKGRKLAERAAVSSRSFVSDRPLTAVAAAIVGGVVLGALANRLAQSRSVDEEEYEPDWEA